MIQIANNPNRASETSWWPKPQVWNNNGLDCGGFWTQSNEEWFVNRVEAIKFDKAQPLTSTAWGNNLRHNYAETSVIINWLTELTNVYLPIFPNI